MWRGEGTTCEVPQQEAILLLPLTLAGCMAPALRLPRALPLPLLLLKGRERQPKGLWLGVRLRWYLRSP
jgi:hypothetical protein